MILNKNIVLVLFGFLLAVSGVYSYNCQGVNFTTYNCHASRFYINSSCSGGVFKTCINNISIDESYDKLPEHPINNGLSIYDYQPADEWGLGQSYVRIVEARNGHIKNYIHFEVEMKTSSQQNDFSKFILNDQELDGYENLHGRNYYGDYPNSYIDSISLGRDTWTGQEYVVIYWFDELEVNNLEERISLLEQWKTTIQSTIDTVQTAICTVHSFNFCVLPSSCNDRATSTNQGTLFPTTSWQTVSGTLSSATDTKRYKLTIPSEGQYEFSTCSADGGSADYDSYLCLFLSLDTVSSFSVSNDYGCGVGTASKIIYPLSAETYYIQVSGHGSDYGSYTLAYRKTPTTTTTLSSTTTTTPTSTTTTIPSSTTTTNQSQCQQICQNWYGKNGVCRNSCLGGEKYNGLRDCPSGQKCCCV